MTMEHKEKATKTKFKIDGAAEPGKGVSIGQWLSRRVPLWAALAAVVAALAVCALFGALSGGPAEDCAPAAATPGKDSKLLKDDKLRAAMQDSLRKDSIARREFSSPDLAFFDLHGDVKSVKLDYEISYLFYGAPKLLEFNELGQWKCPAKTGRGQTVVYTRTAAGNLVRIGSPDEDFYSTNGCVAAQAFSYTYKWQNGRLAEMSPNTTFTYDDRGHLTREVALARDSDEKSVTEYTDYVCDAMGNWVKRRWKSTYTPDSYSDPETESGTETRIITYYRSRP